MSKFQVALWRQIQRTNFTQLPRLADFLQLTAQQQELLAVDRKFPLNVPLRLAQKMAKGSIDCPIFRQFVPLREEQHSAVGFSCDPVGEQDVRMESKLLQKYQGRALLVTTQACAMHCRYCFRRHFDYQQQEKFFAQELEVLRADSSIKEVILSGGDPLSLEQSDLEYLVSQLDAIAHLQRLRFHSRFPIGIPERIDADFLSMLQKLRMQVWFVVHVNHPLELDDDVLYALKQIQRIGIPVLNQSVLLKGVNDDPAVLQSLSERFIDYGIMPYYLHQLDRVQGSAHFEVEETLGHNLQEHLQANLPGYGVPKYVREVSGATNKMIL